MSTHQSTKNTAIGRGSTASQGHFKIMGGSSAANSRGQSNALKREDHLIKKEEE